MPENSLKKYLLYGILAMPLALLGLPLYVYLPTFYAQDIALGVFEVGMILLVARLFDMVLDPIIGYWSDKFFARKTLMLIGMVLLLIGFYFLTHPARGAGYIWLLGFSMLVYFSWSLMSIPYYAIGADLGKNYEQNTKYASYRELFNISGVLLALLLPYIFGVADQPAESLSLMNNTIVFLLPFIFIFFYFRLNTQKLQAQFTSLKVAFKQFLAELKTSKYLFGAFFLNSFANAVPATLFLLYVELVIGAKDKAGLLLLIYFFSGIVALVFWNYIAKKTSKKTAWTFSIINAIVFFSAVPFLGEGDFILFLLITIFSGMSLGADMALPASMQSDLAQNSRSTNQELGGTLFGFFAMLTKLSLAFGVGVSFAILGLFDFTPQNPSDSSLFVLTLLYGLLPVVLKLLAIMVLSKYREKS